MATSKKDYIAIAAIIKASNQRPVLSPRTTREFIATQIAMYFADTSESFDRARFLAARGGES